MGDEARTIFGQVHGSENQYIVIAERLKQMDAMAIDMEVLSINPYWYKKDRDTAAAIVKLQNEKLAELCAAQPQRFAAFASLALQYPDLAVQQLEDAVKKLGLRGAAIGGSVSIEGEAQKNCQSPANSFRPCSTSFASGSVVMRKLSVSSW